MEWGVTVLVTMVLVGLCLLGMSVGLIFRKKTFTSCGNAARDFNGEPIRCAACDARGVDGRTKACTDSRRRYRPGTAAPKDE